MDTDDLIKHAREKFDHAAAKKVLREKYQAKLVFAYQGGMFRVTPEIIIFLDLYRDQDTVLEDLYGNPIRVNANELSGIMRQRWQEQMNAWLIEHDTLSRQR